MTIEELKKKIASLDAKLDDESISNEEFNAIDEEIANLYIELAERTCFCQDLEQTKRTE